VFTFLFEACLSFFALKRRYHEAITLIFEDYSIHSSCSSQPYLVKKTGMLFSSGAIRNHQPICEHQMNDEVFNSAMVDSIKCEMFTNFLCQTNI
jgi:hypothetical protein